MSPVMTKLVEFAIAKLLLSSRTWRGEPDSPGKITVLPRVTFRDNFLMSREVFGERHWWDTAQQVVIGNTLDHFAIGIVSIASFYGNA